jgi:hypothetical protein
VAGSSYEGAVGYESEFPGFSSEQWQAMWKVVTESPGGVFIIGDWLGFLRSPKVISCRLDGGHHCLLA